MKAVIQWLSSVNKRLPQIQHQKYFTINGDPIFSDERFKVLRKTLFSPLSNPAKHINGIHFAHLHGVEMLSELHRQVIELRSHKPFSFIIYLELLCIKACTTCAMSKPCARHLFLCGGLENCIDTFLVKPTNDVEVIKDNILFLNIEIAIWAILK